MLEICYFSRFTTGARVGDIFAGHHQIFATVIGGAFVGLGGG